ncbi:MAG: hypothetical protein JXA06_07700 [Bacteroidetes bacterium]|nr:hypothetical protein [Bacteroidota bacterium]
MVTRRILKLLAVITVLNCVIFAGDVNRISVLLVKNEKVLSKIISDTPKLSKRDSSYFVELPFDSNFVKYDSKSTYTVLDDNYLVFLFYNGSNERMLLKDIKKLRLTVFAKTFDLNYEAKYALFELNKLGSKPRNNSVVAVEASADTIKQSRYILYKNSSELYSAFGNGYGFWFPVNMYATNFKRTEDGVLFTAMPLGIAWGAKWNTSSDFYLGGSVVFSWTIASARDDVKNSFFVHDIAVGVLIDLRGWIYLGYAYPINLTNRPEGLNNQFVIGIGTDISKIFAGK